MKIYKITEASAYLCSRKRSEEHSKVISRIAKWHLSKVQSLVLAAESMMRVWLIDGRHNHDSPRDCQGCKACGDLEKVLKEFRWV